MEATKRKVRPWVWLLIAAVLLFGLLGAKRAWYAWLDISFYWTERTEAELAVKAYAEEQGISIGEYPRSLIELLERNPETKDFVLGYPFRQNQEKDSMHFENPEVRPLFLQWDPCWGYEKYGSDFLAVTGCGPTCLAMAGFYLTGSENMSPGQIADFAEKNGYYESGFGSSWTLISEGAGKLGLTATELPLVKNKIINALEEGCPVILAMGAGDFTTTGHYIVLTGVESGAFRVNDPNSLLNSEKLWTYEQLENQIRNIWAIDRA